MVYLCSADGGNSSIKILVNGTQYLQIPNVTANRNSVNYILDPKSYKTGKRMLDVSVTNNLGNKDLEERDEFILGEQAEEYRDGVNNRPNTDKSTDKSLMRSMLAAVAFSVLKYKADKNEKLDKKMEISVVLSTGLPYAEFESMKNRDEYKNKLKGKHIVEFNNPSLIQMYGVESITLNVKDVILCVEGEGTFYPINTFYLKDVDLFDLEGKYMMVVDIGNLTTELVTKRFVLDYRTAEAEEEEDLSQADIITSTEGYLSKGIPKGVRTVHENVINGMDDKLRTSFIPRDIEFAMLRKNKPGTIKGTDIDISKDFDKHSKMLGTEIGKIVYDVANNGNINKSLYKIYLTGGGSMIEPLVDSFKNVMREQGYKIDDIVPMKEFNPVYSNLVGYYMKLNDDAAQQENEN